MKKPGGRIPPAPAFERGRRNPRPKGSTGSLDDADPNQMGQRAHDVGVAAACQARQHRDRAPTRGAVDQGELKGIDSEPSAVRVVVGKELNVGPVAHHMRGPAKLPGVRSAHRVPRTNIRVLTKRLTSSYLGSSRW